MTKFKTEASFTTIEYRDEYDDDGVYSIHAYIEKRRYYKKTYELLQPIEYGMIFKLGSYGSGPKSIKTSVDTKGNILFEAHFEIRVLGIPEELHDQLLNEGWEEEI